MSRLLNKATVKDEEKILAFSVLELSLFNPKSIIKVYGNTKFQVRQMKISKADERCPTKTKSTYISKVKEEDDWEEAIAMDIKCIHRFNFLATM